MLLKRLPKAFISKGKKLNFLNTTVSTVDLCLIEKVNTSKIKPDVLYQTILIKQTMLDTENDLSEYSYF